MTKHIFYALVCVMTLASCLPYSYHYYKPQAEGGELVIWHSNIIGPSNGVVLKNNGFELKVRYIGRIQMELFVPENNILDTVTSEIQVFKNDEIETIYPVSFSELWGSGEIVKVFKGKARSNVLQRKGSVYSSTIHIEITEESETFRVVLPRFRNESKAVVFSDITFTYDSGIAVSPVN